jgi:signal transduction histidine kinase
LFRWFEGCGFSRTSAQNRATGAKATAMKFSEKIKLFSDENGALTLRWVTIIAFIATGALLLGWDLLEHVYRPEHIEPFIHRLHIVRGISTGVLVSVGIAAVMLRSRIRHDDKLAALQQELIRKERLAAVGELAGGVAHEIRNPLAGIGGAMTVLAREMPADDDTQEVMAEIQREIQRMERLVQELLAFARPGVLHSEWTNVHLILKQAVAYIAYRPDLPKIDLVLELDPKVPEVFADPRDLEQAFENLILNAFQATSEGGKIEVRTQYKGGSVLVSIRDYGSGMTRETSDMIFEPFFTTKARGTGLGLSLVRRVVENYSGEIRVKSGPGEGTTFEMRIPVKVDPAAGASEETARSG